MAHHFQYSLLGQPAVAGMNRTKKVAKIRYSDHGNHHHKVSSNKGNILRKMTMNATELFRRWESDNTAAAAKGRKKRLSPTQRARGETMPDQDQDQPQVDLSPQRFAFSQLALESGHQPQHQPLQEEIRDQLNTDQLPDQFHSDKNMKKKPGILSAVMESGSSQCSSRSKENERGSIRSHSANSSIETNNSMGTPSGGSFRALPRGKCLTQPAEPLANDGSDNAEGNLIVYENDAISVMRKQIHVLSKDKMKNVTRADFRIQGLLGQGTFAQVFQCLHVQTGRLVAVKIVKNKPAYTRQAAVEIDVFRALTQSDDNPAAQAKKSSSSVSSVGNSSTTSQNGSNKWDYMVDLVCYFMHKSHLCLVFELLGLNLYEVLKRRQFRGLPLSVVRTLVKQAVKGIKELSQKSIVHCDLKPENILLVTEDDVDSVVSAGEARRTSSSFEKKSNLSSSMEKHADPPVRISGLSKALGGESASTPKIDLVSQSPANSFSHLGSPMTQTHSFVGMQKIKLIDFGSACFEGQTAHTYIQSRFYRSPEVLIGLPYDSAIDMWSLGCVAAELFLGLPILPGVHEHDQLGRICEMIGKMPDWMLEHGSKSSKYFVKYVPRAQDGPAGPTPPPPTPTPPPVGNGVPSSHGAAASSARPVPQWRLRTQQEYIASLSQNEIRKKGGLAKLEKQPANRYFKQKKLCDIIMHKGQSGSAEDKELLNLFIHFLYGK